jgi:hypothetical protein
MENFPGSEFTRKPLIPHDPRFPIYCPACGKLNYLNARKDFYRGRCAQCGSFFDISRGEFSPLARREVAYPIFLALLTALLWFLFFSQTPKGKAPKSSHPLPGSQNLVAPMAKKFPIPPKPQAAKTFPLPQQLNPPDLPPQTAPPGCSKGGRRPFSKRFTTSISAASRKRRQARIAKRPAAALTGKTKGRVPQFVSAGMETKIPLSAQETRQYPGDSPAGLKGRLAYSKRLKKNFSAPDSLANRLGFGQSELFEGEGLAQGGRVQIDWLSKPMGRGKLFRWRSLLGLSGS